MLHGFRAFYLALAASMAQKAQIWSIEFGGGDDSSAPPVSRDVGASNDVVISLSVASGGPAPRPAHPGGASLILTAARADDTARGLDSQWASRGKNLDWADAGPPFGSAMRTKNGCEALGA